MDAKDYIWTMKLVPWVARSSEGSCRSRIGQPARCVYICIYIYIYVYVYVYIYIYTYMRIYIYIYNMYAYIHVTLGVGIHVKLINLPSVYLCMYVYVCM